MGSPTEVMIESAANVEHDAMLNDWNTRVKASNIRSQAEQARYAGQVYGEQGIFGAGKSLLTAGLKASDYLMPKKQKIYLPADTGPSDSSLLFEDWFI